MVQVLVLSKPQPLYKFLDTILIAGSLLLWRNGREFAKAPQSWYFPIEKLEPGILNPSFRILLVKKAGIRPQEKPNVVSKVLSIGVRMLEDFGVAILSK